MSNSICSSSSLNLDANSNSKQANAKRRIMRKCFLLEECKGSEEDRTEKITFLTFDANQEETTSSVENVSVKENSISHQKLLYSVQLCLQIICTLIIVPFVCECLPERRQLISPPINSRPTNELINQNQLFHRSQEFSLDWAQRLAKNELANKVQNKPASALQQRQDGFTEFNQQQQVPARQSPITDFLTHHSQKLLNTLANNSQQISGQDSQNQVQLQLATPKSYLPTMNKLYNFLFPNNPIMTQVDQNFAATFTTTPPKNETKTSLLSTNNNFAEIYSSDSQRIQSLDESEPKASKQQPMSLNAPYESRPRSLIGRKLRSFTDYNPRENSHNYSIEHGSAGREPEEHLGSAQSMIDEETDDQASFEHLRETTKKQNVEPEEIQFAPTNNQQDELTNESPADQYLANTQANDNQSQYYNDDATGDYLSTANDTKTSVSGREVVNNSLTSEYPNEYGNFKETTGNENNELSEESLLAAQLPSQYDAIIRLPPDGYYDDYFKPASSDAATEQLSNNFNEQANGEFSSMINNIANHADHYETLDQNSNSSLNHQQNHNYSSNSTTTPLDYTNNYFMNQNPLKQMNSNSDQNVEFLTSTSNVSMDEGRNNKRHTSEVRYELPYTKENITHETTKYKSNPDSSAQMKFENKTNNEDSFQIIIANTNSSARDPLNNNEKVINYISEHSGLRPSGKPVRQTFVNKDMNEGSPMDYQNNFNKTDRFEEQNKQNVGHYELGQQNSGPNHQEQNYESSPEAFDQDVDEEDELRRITANGGNFGSYNNNIEQRAQHHGSNYDKMNNVESRNYRAEGRDKRRIEKQKMIRDQTMRRPQVTEATFDPKELILAAPTQAPDITESAIDSITNLPAKMKQIKDNKPDKNELMNELLTALDRVKVAIYKLQPLTAKMNAIYRKSVTSNTRDIIMDNYKGTYAKRYPPGDYDDTYDRMTPSEIATRQLSARQRNGRSNGSIKRYKRDEKTSLKLDESITSAIYAPAPRDLLESRHRNSSVERKNLESNEDSLGLDESKIVATGVGRRLGGKRIEGHLSLSSNELRTYENISATSDSENSIQLDSAAPDFVPPEELLADNDTQSSPLFGYRITIFQSPDSETNEQDNGDQYTYKIDELSELEEQQGDNIKGRDFDSGSDLMETSESSLTETSTLASNYSQPTLKPNFLHGEEQLESSESSKKKVKKMEMEEDSKEMKKKNKKGGEKKKKGAKESEEEEKKKEKKSEMRKKKGEEESKRKKEYKKIKHNKGVLSKEKKTMHRDKHIKAHDRGAAKEKALKERTQIEFFEREQIVDDEFEKGKKSTLKAGWQTGHDSKKTTTNLNHMTPDTMSMDGSHHVEHYAAKGNGIGQETSAGKKSNKFEKKQMEAKGKKFKGWREKGYKIITETEFIDRGSLHDSAYKKRDKGAAHHQKYKKHEVNSEGQHGSMQEIEKKSHKKEEKKEKMREKKEKHMKKKMEEKEKSEKVEEGEKMKKKRKKKKKAMKKKKDGAEDEHESYEESLVTATIEPFPDRSGLNRAEYLQTMSNNQRSTQPAMVLSKGSNTFKAPLIAEQQTNNGSSLQTISSATLLRLLTADHDQVRYLRPEDYKNETLFLLSQSDKPDQEAKRRNDPQTGSLENRANNKQINKQVDRSGNNTILDIVDNATGRQLNKTRIGTYELEEQANKSGNNSSSLAKVVGNSLSKFFPAASALSNKENQLQHFQTTTTTRRPQVQQTSDSQQPSDASFLFNLLQKQQQLDLNIIDPLNAANLMPTPNAGYDNAPRAFQEVKSYMNFPEANQVDSANHLIQMIQRDSRVPVNSFEVDENPIHQLQAGQTFLQPNSDFQQKRTVFDQASLQYAPQASPKLPFGLADQFLNYAEPLFATNFGPTVQQQPANSFISDQREI